MENQNNIAHINQDVRVSMQPMRKQTQDTINRLRIELLKAYDDLIEVNGKDDVKAGLRQVLEANRETGMTVADLSAVFPDAKALKAAKDELLADKLITSDKLGTTHLLRLT